MTLTAFKNAVDKKFLIGVSLSSVDHQGLADRMFRVEPEAVISFDKDRVIASIVINPLDEDDVTDTDNLISILRDGDAWVDIDRDNFVGELHLTMETPDKKVITIAGKQITSFQFHISIAENVEYVVTFYFSEVRYLHGLSMFYDKKLGSQALDKLMPLLTTNAFGESPVLVRYTTKKGLFTLTPDGLTDMVYVNPKTHVWLINTTTSRLGLDMEHVSGYITITDKGYLLSATLKDGSLLEIFT